jgi:hypothetical protein
MEKLGKENLHKMHSSPSDKQIMKSSRIGWAGKVESMGEERNM